MKLTKKRFLAKVQKSTDCWLWSGQKRGKYGGFWLDGKSIGAHRAAYLLFIGSIPDSMYVLHSCDVPLCVNPKHLFLGTAKDNTTDMYNKNRANHFTGINFSKSKLNTEAIKVIKYMSMYKKVSNTKLAQIYNVDQSNVSLIVNNKLWTHVCV